MWYTLCETHQQFDCYYDNGPYLQWHQNAKMAALAGDFCTENCLNRSNLLRSRWRNQYTLSCETLNIKLYCMASGITKPAKNLKVNKTHGSPLDDSAYLHPKYLVISSCLS